MNKIQVEAIQMVVKALGMAYKISVNEYWKAWVVKWSRNPSQVTHKTHDPPMTLLSDDDPLGVSLATRAVDQLIYGEFAEAIIHAKDAIIEMERV